MLVVSGDEAASDPGVRSLAERSDAVIAITMYHSLAVGWADLVLPATASLEREGTSMNLEGRVQRLRRAVASPVPDELAWLSKLAARFGVALSPHPAVVFEELSERIYGGLQLEQLGERAELPVRAAYVAPEPAVAIPEAHSAQPDVPTGHFVGTLRLLRYTPLLGTPGGAGARAPVPAAGSRSRARRRRRRPAGIATGDLVTVRSNGTSLELRARVDRRLIEGVARVADEHAADLHLDVEVVRA